MKKINLYEQDAKTFVDALDKEETPTNEKFMAATKRYKDSVQMNTTDKFYWCIDHPNIGVDYAQGHIELTPHMVNPLNDTIEPETHLNTKQQWWIEFSKLEDENDSFATHYWDLDCGGDTVDEAVDALYTLMLEQYGEYK